MAIQRNFKPRMGRSPGSRQHPPKRTAYGQIRVGNHLIDLDAVNEHRDHYGHPHLSARDAREKAQSHQPEKASLYDHLVGPRPFHMFSSNPPPKKAKVVEGPLRVPHVAPPTED